MILQSLHNYYKRKELSGELSPAGYGPKELPFIIVIDRDGRFVALEDTRATSGKRKTAKVFTAPKEKERSGSRAHAVANFLWDHTGYVLAHPRSQSPKDVELARRQHASFVSLIHSMYEKHRNLSDLGSVLSFLCPEQISRLKSDPIWSECAAIPGCNISFRIAGEPTLVFESNALRPVILQLSQASDEDDEIPDGEQTPVLQRCLVSGQVEEIARTQPRTPILGATPSSKSNAKLVSFQRNSGFDSYGKEQAYNAPVGRSVAFAYTTALNHLLRRGSRQRIQAGDAAIVFWSAAPAPLEDDFAALFGSTRSDDPDGGTQAVRNLRAAVKKGAYVPDAGRDTEFYVLALSPNAARIAVRFWLRATVGELAREILQHFDDLSIVGPSNAPEHLSIGRILEAIASPGREDDVPPNVAGAFFRSALDGTSYPSGLLQAAVRRLRLPEKEPKSHRATTQMYIRVAIVKACLNRSIRHRHLDAKELHVSLDPDNTDPAYRLGRLFAALERIQTVAQPGINATIRDRYYGAASSSPSSVFPVLLRLKNHHLSKLDNPRLIGWFEKKLTEIFSGINPTPFPAHLSLPKQGLFAIGYYHQQLAFFKKRGSAATEDNPSSDLNQEPTP
jgi:CRISPR-associated protein Csd1